MNTCIILYWRNPLYVHLYSVFINLHYLNALLPCQTWIISSKGLDQFLFFSYINSFYLGFLNTKRWRKCATEIEINVHNNNDTKEKVIRLSNDHIIVVYSNAHQTILGFYTTTECLTFPYVWKQWSTCWRPFNIFLKQGMVLKVKFNVSILRWFDKVFNTSKIKIKK